MSNPALKKLFRNDDSVYKSSFKATHPSKETYIASKTVVLDSRQRNIKKYKYPNYYRLDVGDVFKNITSVELRGVIIPKSSYNVHSSNNKIDFGIGDTVTVIKIIEKGAGYTSPPIITLTGPKGGGVTATASSFINAQGQIQNIAIVIPGSGYTPGNPPAIIISPPGNSKNGVQAKAVALVGIHYTAELRVGEYTIGGNPTPPSTTPTGLLLEIQNAMNYTVNGGAYDPASTSPFAVRVVSQYPELGATPGTPEAADTNACRYNRIQVTNVNSSTWELLWGTGPNHLDSSNSIFGFNIVDTGLGVFTPAVVGAGGEIIPAGTTIRANFDYNLHNDPDFVIMSLELGDESMDRVTSLDQGLDHQFAALVFDANAPENLQDLSGTSANVGGIEYLEGPTTRGTFWRDAGRVKPLKGYDFDTKKFSFRPAKGKVSSIMVKFTKFGMKPGGVPRFYNFGGREHTLIFEMSAADLRAMQRD